MSANSDTFLPKLNKSIVHQSGKRTNPPTYSLIPPSTSYSSCLLSVAPTLPLFPAEIVSSSEHDEKAKDGEEDDGIPRHHQTTGPPLNLFKKINKYKTDTKSWFLVKQFFQKLTERQLLL